MPTGRLCGTGLTQMIVRFAKILNRDLSGDKFSFAIPELHKTSQVRKPLFKFDLEINGKQTS